MAFFVAAVGITHALFHAIITVD